MFQRRREGVGDGVRVLCRGCESEGGEGDSSTSLRQGYGWQASSE
jgi:hypothetical protein